MHEFDRLLILLASIGIGTTVVLAPCARYWNRRWRRALVTALYWREEARDAKRQYLETLGTLAVRTAQCAVYEAALAVSVKTPEAHEILKGAVN